MRSIDLLAIPMTVGLLLSGCSSGSGLNNTGGSTSTAGAGGAGQAGAAAGAGGAGPGSTTGGVQASAGNAGSLAGIGGGTAGTSGATGAGGTAGAGGTSAPLGGTTRTGGAGTTARTSTAGGATSTTGGNSAGAGGAKTSTGGASGGASSSGTSRDAGVGDGGIAASGYCEGNAPKLTYQGQTVSPGVTDFSANIAMDCCNGYGVNLHSTPSLGFDVAIELVLSISIFTPGEHSVGGPTSMKARALVYKSSEPITSVASANGSGTLRVFAADGSAGLTEFQVCLEVTDAVSGLAGTKLYVPRVVIGSYQVNKRFQIFLLKDKTVSARAAATQPLDDLVLADSPALDLGDIAYVEKSTTKMGFNPGQKYGTSFRSTLGSPLDLPFVAVADGTRIYLGTFTSLVSSIAPVGPFVSVEDIEAESLTVQAPLSGTDPRNDERIIRALSERGKLVP